MIRLCNGHRARNAAFRTILPGSKEPALTTSQQLFSRCFAKCHSLHLSDCNVSRGGGEGKPSKKVTLNGSQSARDQWPPIPPPSPRCTAAALYSIFKHMATSTRRRNSTWPLETDILASKREGKLFNEDGSRWWLYISFCNSRHTALLQPALTFVLSLSQDTLRRLCVLTLYFGFTAFFFGCRVHASVHSPPEC